MSDRRLGQVPTSKTGMLIRRPVAEVFEAFVDGAAAAFEHGVRLNLVADRFPEGIEER
jgi:hypothetical protein